MFFQLTLSDHSSEQILKSGMGFKTWNLPTIVCVSLFVLKEKFYMCAWEGRTPSWGLVVSSFSLGSAAMCGSPNSCDFTDFCMFWNKMIDALLALTIIS